MRVGFCIYCFSTKPPLTREHVMPRGLGGNVPPSGSSEATVLGDASCERCRVITQQIEERCLLDMFGPARRRLGLTRKDRDPGKATAIIKRSDGSTDIADVDYVHLPGGLIIPSYRAAAIFLPEQAWQGPDLKMIITRSATFPSDDVVSIGIELKVDANIFARMLAKIAYGFAVYQLGHKSFIPTVRNFIVRNDIDYRYHVGGFCEEIPDPEKTDKLHWMKIVHHDGLVIVNIQLFQEHGGPVNYVVVGKDLRY